MSNRNTIPDFNDESLQSLAQTVRAMKQILEEMTGQAPRTGQGAAHMFLGIKPPDPRAGDVVKRGDLWVHTLTQDLHYWDGQIWRPIA